MEQTPRRGPIEGISRILRELLRTPGFKQSVRVLVSELDPENAALFARTLMDEDPEFFLSLLGASPAIANALVAAGDEMIERIDGFPPIVLAGFAAEVIGQVDSRTLGRMAGRGFALAAKLGRVDDPNLAEAALGFMSGLGEGLSEVSGDGAKSLTALLVEALVPALGMAASRLGAKASEDPETRALVENVASSVRAVARDNPAFMKEIVSPLVSAGREALATMEETGPDERVRDS